MNQKFCSPISNNVIYDWLENNRIRQGIPQTIDDCCYSEKSNDFYSSNIILSGDGEFYEDGVPYNCKATCIVYKNGVNITNTLNKSNFVWERISNNVESDVIWNNKHLNVGNVINLTEEDLIDKRTEIKIKILQNN